MKRKSKMRFELPVRTVNGEKMDVVDGVRFVALWTVILQRVEDCVVRYRKAIVERDIWEGESRTLAAAPSGPSLLQVWNELQQYLLPGFIAEVARLKPIPLVVYDPAKGSYQRPGAETVFGFGGPSLGGAA